MVNKKISTEKKYRKNQGALDAIDNSVALLELVGSMEHGEQIATDTIGSLKNLGILTSHDKYSINRHIFNIALSLKMQKELLKTKPIETATGDFKYPQIFDQYIKLSKLLTSEADSLGLTAKGRESKQLPTNQEKELKADIELLRDNLND